MFDNIRRYAFVGSNLSITSSNTITTARPLLQPNNTRGSLYLASIPKRATFHFEHNKYYLTCTDTIAFTSCPLSIASRIARLTNYIELDGQLAPYHISLSLSPYCQPKVFVDCLRRCFSSPDTEQLPHSLRAPNFDAANEVEYTRSTIA